MKILAFHVFNGKRSIWAKLYGKIEDNNTICFPFCPLFFLLQSKEIIILQVFKHL